MKDERARFMITGPKKKVDFFQLYTKAGLPVYRNGVYNEMGLGIPVYSIEPPNSSHSRLLARNARKELRVPVEWRENGQIEIPIPTM